MNATDLYRAMLRDQIGPALRGQGFKGSTGKWTLTDPASGDQAIVQAQSSHMSSATEVWFAVNLAVVPSPWWAWQSRLYASKSVTESHGLWHARLQPTTHIRDRGGEPWWRLTDTASANGCGGDAITGLLERGIPLLRQALDRQTLILLVRNNDPSIRHPITEVPLAILLSDNGPSEELNDVLQKLAAIVEANPRLDRQHFAKVDAWARQRAGGIRRS